MIADPSNFDKKMYYGTVQHNFKYIHFCSNFVYVRLAIIGYLFYPVPKHT